MTLIDRDWLRAHPLPVLDDDASKDERGRILLVGGAEFVPGALRLTGEAALRAGAGKLQMATVASIAPALGVLMPEAAMIALPADDDGEIGLDAASLLTERVKQCDALVIGPGMSVGDKTHHLVAALLEHALDRTAILLDAAAFTCAAGLGRDISAASQSLLMTPHHGEMARFTGLPIQTVARDAADIAMDVARKYGAVVMLKGSSTIIATPEGTIWRYESGCVGLATGGSGDVLAGIAGGLLARGAAPDVAAGWAVWLHSSAGQELSRDIGPVGFLARDLLQSIPRLMAEA